MIFLEETKTHWVFACQSCKDINKVISAQIRVKPLGKALAAEQVRIDRMKKAESVQKRLGKITYWR